MNADNKNPAAVALGRLGGLARKNALTQEQRIAIARKAGQGNKGIKRKLLDKQSIK